MPSPDFGLTAMISLTLAPFFGQVAPVPVDDPLTRPIAASRAAEWLAPAPPVRIYGNSYLVGFGGLSVALIDTGDGLILVDGAMPQSAASVLANVRALGFDPKNIRYILSTEPHFDHAGGLAALARDTGATVLSSERGAEGLRSGRLAADDPQLDYDHSFPAVANVRGLKDGQEVRLGDTVVTAEATPGHTMGSMSWRWQACVKGKCKSIVFASSLNPVSADGYKYSAATSRGIVAGYRQSYARMKAIPCDILVSAHPDNAGDLPGGNGRYNGAPGACAAYARSSEGKLNKRVKDGE